MAKRKKDFQKVRVKVGRKLKRQNETVINLHKKRIILPKEREIIKIEGDKTSIQTFDTSVHSLNIEDSSVQHSSLRALNRLLDPLTKEISTVTFLDKNILTLSSNFIEKVINIHRRLLGTTENLGCDIQLGNLIFVLGRFCRRVDDSRFCEEIRQLFFKIVQIASTHPKISDIICELDQVIINLLQRNEQLWKFFGCQLASYLFCLHCRLITTMSHLYTLSNRKKVVYSGVFDSLQQSIRFRVYCHLFIQCYNNLKQNRTFKILSKNRANLILVTMMYLKDNQYTCSLSYSRGSHPWLYCFPYFTNESTHFHIPCKGYYLKELIDFHPVSYSFDSSLFSVIKESLVYPCTMKNMIVNNKVISNNKWSEKYRKNCTELEILQGSSVGGYIPAWFQEEHDDRVLGHGLIDEGLILLDELMEHPNEETLSSLYYFLRSLRVLLETKQPGFFISYSGVKHHSSGWKLDINNITPDLSASLERFLIKFYSLYPLQLSTNSSSLTTSFTQINNHKQKGNNKYSFLLTSSNGQKSVNLTRKQFKQERKRRNKQLKRHMTSVAGASTDSCPNNGPSTITISSADSSINVNHNPSIKVNSNNQVLYWIHLINQSAFELFTYIEYYSIRCLEVNCRSPFSWPPPEDTQERLVKILFDQLSQMTLMSTTQLANIHYDISCWLRAFDLYLLAPYRFKWNVDKSTRLFIPLVLVFLGKLFHQLTINIVDKDKPLSKRQHYLIGRCTGLLTTFLTKDLLLSMMEYNKIESKLNDDDDDDDMNESINEDFQVNCQGVDYDEMWIWKKLSYINLPHNEIKPIHGSIFSNLLKYLVQFSLKEPPRVYYSPPLSSQMLSEICNQYPSCDISIGNIKDIQIVDSTWTACLLQLYHVKYSHAIRCVDANKELSAKLNTTANYLDRLTPMNILNEKLHISCTESLDNQIGWLVPGFLARITDGRYACSVFWRPLKDNRNNHHNNNLLS